MKKYILLLIISVFASDLIAQSNTKNYIKETVYRTVSNTGGGVVLYSPTDFENITYFDGLGRPEQVIQKNASPDNEKNIVKHIEYVNNTGQTKDFLPFTVEGKTTTSIGGGLSYTSYNGNFVDNANTATVNFYNTVENELTQNPFWEMKPKNNLSTEIEEVAAPGTDWSMSNGHTVKVDVFANTAGEVKWFKATASWNATTRVYGNALINSGFFAEGSLSKHVVKGENWTSGKNNTVEIFKDNDEKVHLKRAYNNNQAHDTYYVYNDRGQLAYVLTPESLDTSLTNEVLDELCFQYNYDENGLLVEKKVPGKKWQYTVYDKAGRLAFSGPNLNPFGTGEEGWLFMKYDYLNRMAYKGFYTGHTVNGTNRAALQGLLRNQSVYNEKRQTSTSTVDGVSVSYTNEVFPTASVTMLEVNYYDSYGFANGPSAPENVNGVAPNTNVKGLLTGIWTRNLTTTAEKKGDLTYLVYDAKYRPIRVHTNNMQGGSTQVNSVFNFFGNPTQIQTVHKKTSSSATLTTVENFTYNAREYLLKHTHTVNGQAEELIASYEYDGLGKLVRKNVGNTAIKPLQKVDYKYNVRGWLKQINNPNNLNENSDNDLFGLTVNYNTAENLPATVKKQYNGNISSVEWKTRTDNIKRGYVYSYDDLNRLTDASYLKNSILTGGFKEQSAYSKNGNITSMNRTAEIDGQVVAIDDAAYNYSYNKLMSVADATNHPQGINDVNKTGDDYAYDAFGNLIADKNRKITSITYNHLSQPVTMTYATGDKIVFTYDSNGNRLKKTVTQNGVTNTVEYLDGFEYKDNVLKYIATKEGFIKFENGQYNYVYQYKDHVGNVRLVYQDINKNGTVETTEILDESNYYAFGLKHGYYNQIANNFSNALLPNKGFNGQPQLIDLDANLTLMDFRMYDGALGRFTGIDLLADMFAEHSPYHFAYNNPISFIDPSGLSSGPSPNNTIEIGSNGDVALYYTDEEGNLAVIFFINRKSSSGREPEVMKEFAKDGGTSGGGPSGSASGSASGGTSGGTSGGGGNRSGARNSDGHDGNSNWLYDFLYNNPAVTGYSSGEYGAYISDANSISVSGGVNGIFFSFNFELGIAMTNNDVALVVGGDLGTGLNPEMPGFSLAGGFGFHDNYGGNSDVLDGLAGKDIGWSANLMYGGISRSQTADDNWMSNEQSGVRTTKINIGLGIGVGQNRSQAESYKLSNGIQNITDWYNTWKF